MYKNKLSSRCNVSGSSEKYMVNSHFLQGRKWVCGIFQSKIFRKCPRYIVIDVHVLPGLINVSITPKI